MARRSVARALFYKNTAFNRLSKADFLVFTFVACLPNGTLNGHLRF